MGVDQDAIRPYIYGDKPEPGTARPDTQEEEDERQRLADEDEHQNNGC